MNSKDFLKEGFVEDATDVHMDHEVQMAREECYHAAEHALAIHKLLRNISEQQGLEGWVSSKITLANDYLNTVREHLEYELLQPQIDDVAIGMPIAENEQQGVAEGMEGQVVFSGSGADGGKYEIIQTGPTDFMIHANGKHIDTYSSLQRAMSVLKNEVPGLKKGVAEGSITEASKDFAERHYAAKEIDNLLRNLEREESPTVTPEIIKKMKELVAITGRGQEIPYFGSAGSQLDKLIDMYRQSQIQSGQMPQFSGSAPTSRDMARQIANQTRGTYRYFKPESWTTRSRQRYRDPADYVVYPDQQSYDDALEWIENKGKKVRYRDHFGHLTDATQIGRYIIEPSSFTQSAFSDEARTTHRISVRLAKTINQGGREQVDITDQQAAALHDIAATRSASAMSTVQSIMAVLRGMEDVKRVIANSKKIDPRDKAKLDAIIAAAGKFQEPGNQGVAEGSINEGQYEMMMRNGRVKKFVAKDDADAKRIAAGHGAKSVIKLKGGIPAGKVAEQGVVEGLPGSLSKSDYTSGKTVKHTSSNCTACHGRKTMYKLDGKLYADNKAGATKVKCPTCKGTGDKQGVAEGSAPGQAAWKKEMIEKGAVSFKRDQHGGGTVDRIVAYDKDGKVVGGFNRKGVAEGAKCNHTMEGKNCPVHGLNECPGMKARALAEWRKQQRALKHNQSVMEFAPLGAALAAGAGLATGAGLSLLKKQDPKEPSMQQRIKDKKRQEAEQRFREKMDREQTKVSSSDSKTFTQDLDLINVPESKSKLKSRKIREQGITDQEIRQRIQPTFQATDAQINDPEWMRSRGLIPMQDIEQDLAQTKQAEVQQAQQRAGTNIRTSSGAPVIAGSKMMKETTAGSVAGVVNPKSNKPKNQIGSLFGGSYKQSRKKQ